MVKGGGRERRELWVEGFISTRGSFKNIIKFFYGKSIFAKVNTFSKLRSSLPRNYPNLAFLKCYNNIPKFLQLKDHLRIRIP